MPELIHHALRTGMLVLLVALSAVLPGVAAAELSIASGSATTGSQPVETAPEWVYTLRQGDTLASLSAELLQNPVNGQRLLTHNGLAANTELRSGDTLRIPVFWLRRLPESPRSVAAFSTYPVLTDVKLPLPVSRWFALAMRYCQVPALPLWSSQTAPS